MMEKNEVAKNIYIFHTNYNLFYKKVKKESDRINDVEKIKINIEFLNNEFNKIELKVAIKLASKILEQLKLLKCEETLLFEKADLIVEAFAIKENIELLLKA